MNALTQFGLMQKISTGNMAADMLICLLMPLILKHLAGYWTQFKEWIMSAGEKKADVFVRKIEYHVHQGYYYYYDSDNNRNKVLQVREGCCLASAV